MHEIDLSKFSLRTDLLIDEFKDNPKILHKEEVYNDILVDNFTVTKESNSKRRVGDYVTISFQDITDKDNFKNCQDIFIRELKKILESLHINNNSSFLIVGLGNKNTTADSLGPKTVENVLVTRHLFMLGDVEDGYKSVAAIAPGVMGDTGIEVVDILMGIITNIKPDYLIVVDALMSTAINRLNKTIQITNTGIFPGSGIGNIRKEISAETLGIPVIAIGVPTIVAASTIVVDTLEIFLQKISYNIHSINNPSSKLKLNQYINEKSDLTVEDKTKLLGMVGALKEEDLNELILEILSPINYNLMVSPKEEDFLMDKLSLLLANGINKSLHSSFNTTK